MGIRFTCVELILARAAVHVVLGCSLAVALDAEQRVWRRHRRSKPTAEQWLDLVWAEIERLEVTPPGEECQLN